MQFSPTDSRRILYNNEWTYRDCGIRRVWLLDENDHFHPVREITGRRSRNDWVCHEIWSPDGKEVIYHGGYDGGDFFLGRHNLETGRSEEAVFDPRFTSYGHFTLVSGDDYLCSDGYFQMLEAECDRGSREYDPEKNVDFTPMTSKYITVLKVDWDKGTVDWRPLCEHGGEWYDQDSHPHPISDGKYVYFTSRRNRLTNVYRVRI